MTLDTLSTSAILAIRRASVRGTFRQPERRAVQASRALWRAAVRLQEAHWLRASLADLPPFVSAYRPTESQRRPFTPGTWQD